MQQSVRVRPVTPNTVGVAQQSCRPKALWMMQCALLPIPVRTVGRHACACTRPTLHCGCITQRTSIVKGAKCSWVRRRFQTTTNVRCIRVVRPHRLQQKPPPPAPRPTMPMKLAS